MVSPEIHISMKDKKRRNPNMTDWFEIKQKKEELYKDIPQQLKDAYEVSGIYKILIDGKMVYVGQSQNCLNRWIAHKINTLFNYGQHDYQENKYDILREAYKRGYSISCELIEECPKEDLKTRENYWINELNPILNGGGGDVGFRGWLFLEQL